MTTTNQHPIHVERLICDIYEDHPEEGVGEHTGAGMTEPIGKTFANREAMAKYLSDCYGLSADVGDYEQDDEKRNVIRTSRAVANHSEAQNGGWMDPTEEEVAAWLAGRQKLYLEEYQIEYHHVCEPACV